MNLRSSTTICIIVALIFFTTSKHCISAGEVTDEDYRNYFGQLNSSEQKTHMSQIVAELRSSLPMVISDYHQWSGIIYMPTQNILLKTFTFNIDYNNIDHSQLPELKRHNVRNSINSLCTGNLYKTWMFKAGLTIRNNFATVANQNLFNYSITKDDCLEVGYQYP